MLRVPDPDTVIAERLSGATPFVARDHFSSALEASATPPEVAEPPRLPEPREPTAREPESRAATDTPPAPAKKPASGEIDLSIALGELDGPDERPQRPATLGDVFKGIRKEVPGWHR